MTFRLIIIVLFILRISLAVQAQTVSDTIGNTPVEISVAVDTSHFEGGYTSGPWDLYWGPDQKLWYTNHTRLCTYDPSTQVVDTILSLSSGYIMSVTTHGNFFSNPYVYLTVDTAVYYGGGRIIKLFRYDYSLTGDSLYNPQFLLQWYHPGEHSGGRIIYGLDDKLYVTTAEYFRSEDTLFHNSGKVLRVNPDGTVPADNPRADYTFTYGHRNPQGIVQVPNGNLLVSEYGQSIDEVNLLEVNRFYGWWIYDGDNCFQNQDSCDYYDTIAVFPIDAGPNPPSGIDYYNHPSIPEFNGLVQAVTGWHQGLIVYTMNAAFDSVLLKSYYLTDEYGRVRDVCAAPDGSLYFIARDRWAADIRVIKNELFTSSPDAPPSPVFSFYPNPASGKISFQLHHSWNAATIVVSDLSGKNILFQNITGSSNELDISKIPEGCYFISVRIPNQQVASQKLIKIN